MQRRVRCLILTLHLCLFLPAYGTDTVPPFEILVFHAEDSIHDACAEDAIAAIRGLADEHRFAVDVARGPDAFRSANLGRYAAVIFLNTPGHGLNSSQQQAFERYIQNGGGFVGIHAAANASGEWTWYSSLVGATASGEQPSQPAEVLVLDRVHPSTQSLPSRWSLSDGWYDFVENPRGRVHVLAALREDSYTGGQMGHDHPIAWAHAYDGGRAWYTGLGHNAETYKDPQFLEHLLGGIEWAAGRRRGDVAATLASSFEKVVLTTAVTDPMQLSITTDGRVFIAERAGAIKMWDPAMGLARTVGVLPTRMTVEDGLLGFVLDPNFDENSWLYAYYAPVDRGPTRLSRFTFSNGVVDLTSEKVLLTVPVQQEKCCHSGGALTFGPGGELFLSTGDNTTLDPFDGSSIDERPGMELGDAQRTAANTNDLRGKILRIRPLPDGTYAIPEGNLFEGDALHRPEIYTMGHRNPFRISVDPETGWLYWGEVGISHAPSEERGPAGMDEFNQAREAGFFGWPYFTGNNEAYRDFDYATKTPGPFFDPEAPVNESPNNTGARELPPAQPAMLWYSYGVSEKFPELGVGGMSAMAGPVYRFNQETAAPHALPAYYDGSVFIYEWMRNWIKELKLDDDGNVLKINPFIPEMSFTRPINLELGADGRLYVIEWGGEFWGSNRDARVVRLDYHGSQDRPSDAVSMASSASESTGNTAPVLSFVRPLNGSFFDAGSSVSYELSVSNPEQSDISAEKVRVRRVDVHDTHEHYAKWVSGVSGSVHLGEGNDHLPYLFWIDDHFVLEATYTDSGTPGAAPISTSTRVVLQPRRKQAEHVSIEHRVERRTFGAHMAAPNFAETALITMAARNEAYVAYDPINFHEVEAITLRVKPEAGGAVEFRLDSPEGRLLAELHVGGDGTNTADTNGKEVAVREVHDLARPETSERVLEAYDGWMDLRFPIDYRGGPHALYLVFRGQATGTLMQIDWLEFHGPTVPERAHR